MMSEAESARTKVELEVYNSGWVNGPRFVVLPGSGSGRFRLPVLFGLIRHPERGGLLYDTGFSTRFFRETRRYPYRFARYLVPSELDEQSDPARQLGRAGVAPEQVQAIILGHGHLDHVTAAADFPRARLIADAREWKAMQGPALELLFRGYLKSLYWELPNPIETVDLEQQGRPYGPFEQTIDLYGDGSLRLVSLPGHSAGHMGLLVHTADGDFLFIGDAAWISENYLELRPPSRIVGTIWSSRSDLMRSMSRVRDFARDNPDIMIIPAHCPATWQRLLARGVGRSL